MKTTKYEQAVIYRTANGSALSGKIAPNYYVNQESIWGIRGVTAGGTFYPEDAKMFRTLKEAKAWIDEVLAMSNRFVNHRGAVTMDFRTYAGQPHQLPVPPKVRV